VPIGAGVPRPEGPKAVFHDRRVGHSITVPRRPRPFGGSGRPASRRESGGLADRRPGGLPGFTPTDLMAAELCPFLASCQGGIRVAFGLPLHGFVWIRRASDLRPQSVRRQPEGQARPTPYASLPCASGWCRTMNNSGQRARNRRLGRSQNRRVKRGAGISTRGWGEKNEDRSLTQCPVNTCPRLRRGRRPGPSPSSASRPPARRW